MDKGILYGLGVGPGDPELLTLKAARILKEADVIAVPDKGSGEKTALNIVKDFVEGKPILPCPSPMIRDTEALDRAHEAIADSICAVLEQGKTVAYITLGDPSIYSTYCYVQTKVRARGYEAVMVPGVPSFCAAAARLGTPLCEGSQRLMIVPASHRDVSDCLGQDANLVFMKAGREIDALKRTLQENGLLDRAGMVENCTMAEERVYPRFADAPDGSGYFSVVLVKKELPER